MTEESKEQDPRRRGEALDARLCQGEPAERGGKGTIREHRGQAPELRLGGPS